MTTMIERVARAIAKADATSSYEELARAAIEAMREPTDSMVDAGDQYDGCRPVDIYYEMIDAAIAEQQP